MLAITKGNYIISITNIMNLLLKKDLTDIIISMVLNFLTILLFSNPKSIAMFTSVL